MKKLMMAVAIVCAAVGAQAAALNWTSWGYTLSGGTTGDEIWGGAGTTAYLIQVTDAANFAVSDDLVITGGSIVDYNSDDGSGTFGGTWSTDTLTNGQTYQFAILATSKPGTPGALPSDGFYGVDKNGGNGTAFYEVTWDANLGGDIAGNENFYGLGVTTAVQSVPEPTSGLLLLLGVAGLALRRRRA